MATSLRSLIEEALIEPLEGNPEIKAIFTGRFDRKRILFDSGAEQVFIRVHGDVDLREGRPLHFDLELSGDQGLLAELLGGKTDPVAAILSGDIDFRQPTEPEAGLHDATDMLYFQDTIRKLNRARR